MTREEQINWLCRLRADLNNGVIFTPWNKEFTEALNDILEQESITNNDLEVDCISRKQAKKAIRNKFKDLPSRVEINTILNELPSAIPIRPKGHWTPLGNYDDYGIENSYKCSECGDIDTYPDNYCPNCGANMTESEGV